MMEESENKKIKNLESISELAQISDKLQNQINSMVSKIEPTNSKYTFGIFWIQWGKTIKFVSSILIPFIIIIWSFFSWWTSFENRFGILDKNINNILMVQDKTIEKLEQNMEILQNRLSKKTPENVSDELLTFRRDVFKELLKLETIQTNVDKLFDLTLLLNISKNNNENVIPFLLDIDKNMEKMKIEREKNEEIITGP